MNEKEHLVTIRSSITDEVKEFYISEETLDYLRKNVFLKSRTTPILPKEKCVVDSNDLLIYIKHAKYQIFNLETDKAKLEERIKKDNLKCREFTSKYYDLVNSMNKYSKMDKFSKFIDLPQEEVDALIKYRKAWIVFKQRRHDLLLEIHNNKLKIDHIDVELNKYNTFLKGLNG